MYVHMYVVYATPMSMYIPICIPTTMCMYCRYAAAIPMSILDVYLTQTLYASAGAMTYVSSGCSSLCYAMVLCL
jgi:hypothetical protein